MANSGNGMAVAFKTPLTSASCPMWQFKVGTRRPTWCRTFRQRLRRRIRHAEHRRVHTALRLVRLSKRVLASYTITDPCGTVYWLATDGKGNVYSNNYCGYVTLFVTPDRFR